MHELRNVEFPSIIGQLESKFWARVKLDKTILEIIGFETSDIDNWLPKIYDSLVNELKATASMES